MVDLFHLGDMYLKYKTVVMDKLEAIDERVNNKVSKVSSHLNLQTTLARPKIEIKIGTTTSIIKMQ